MSFERSGAEEDPSSSEVTRTTCWRCDLVVYSDDAQCPHCGAQLLSPSPQQIAERIESTESKMIKALFTSFAVLLVTSIIHYLMLEKSLGDVEEITARIRTEVFTQILVIEAIDTIVVLFVTSLYFRQIFFGQQALAPLAGWGLSLPLLALSLGLNYAYHYVLRSILLQPMWEDDLVEKFDLLVLIAYCIQPAIVEELYVRGFCMSALMSVTGRNASVWISAAMFGLLHISSPLSMPYLMLLGGVLGYVRLMTGGLLAPMLLHFLHNLLICLWN